MSTAAPPPPPPDVSSLADAQVQANESVSSDDVLASLVLSVFGAIAVLVGWAIMRSTPLRHHLVKRTALSDVLARPPPLGLGSLMARCFGYLGPVFTVHDGEFVQTAGLDALILCRFLVLGLHVFTPVTVLCCAVLLPLCMTGTFVHSTQEAATAQIMQYSLSNIEPGSTKLWAPFALSYAVLAWFGWCLAQHYKSYALMRIVQQRHSMLYPLGGAPRMVIVGYPERRGWPAVRHTLAKLFSPTLMLRSDAAYVKALLAQAAALDVADASADASSHGSSGGGHEPGAAADGSAAAAGDGDGGQAEAAPLMGTKSLATLESPLSDTAILPWWLPPEQVPARYSGVLGSCTPAGKSDAVARKRTVGLTPAGHRVWVPAELYAVLFTTAGPLPAKDVLRLLRPTSNPASIHVDGGDQQQGDASGGRGDATSSAANGAAAGLAGGNSVLLLDSSGGQKAGGGAEVVAVQLEEALQQLFPSSFTRLVRVHNHQAADSLLVQHDVTVARRERASAAAAAARAQLKATDVDGAQQSDAGARTWRQRRAAARLAKAEAQEAQCQARVTELEAQVAEAQAAALAAPLGTAFFALFRDQTAAAIAGSIQASLASGINLHVRPAPGPDDVNWAALWSTWGQRLIRGACVLPFIILLMLFPIGVITGALTNLTTAVCSGTPDTNDLYWGWYCDQDSAGAKLLKSILQGILPPIISMFWDTFVCPIYFWATSQSERRHVSLSDLDRRITVLLFTFAVCNTFLGSVLGGAIFQQLGTFMSKPGYWLQALGAALPACSTFFINYIILSALASNLSRFLWPHMGVGLSMTFHTLHLMRPTCERDAAMTRYPPSFRPPRQFGKFMLITIMALSYAVVAPLVLPTAVCFFFVAWIVWRYHALYVYHRSYEAGGRIFETLFSLCVTTAALFTIFTAIVLAAKSAYAAALIMLFTQLPAARIYHSKVVLSVGHYARQVPLQATLGTPTASIDPAMYTPPPLRPHGVGWQPEWGKVWQWYGVGRCSF